MAFFNTGTDISIEVKAGSADRFDSAVILRGFAGNYPIIGVHLTADEAAELARQIAVALESIAQPEAA